MSDHASGPRAFADPVVDITDMYAFPSPQRNGTLVLVLNVFPFAGMSALFSDAVEYRLRLRPTSVAPSESDSLFAVAEREYTIACRFDVPAKRDNGLLEQQGTCTASTGHTVHFAVNDERGAQGQNLRVFAGVRMDPFFFDGRKALETLMTGKLAFTTPGSSTMFRQNVLGIVIEVDIAKILGSEGPLFAVVGETLTMGSMQVRLERYGRPDVKNLLIFPSRFDGTNRDIELRDLYNQEDVFKIGPAYVNALRTRMNSNLPFWDGLDAKTDWPLNANGVHPLTELFMNDFMALAVEGALQQMLAADRSGGPSYDASTVRVWTHRVGSSISIAATDARHSVPVTIATVTSADVNFQQSTPGAIAASWQLTLQGALIAALLTREPAVERQHLREVIEIGMTLAIWTAMISFLLNAWQRRIETLTNALAQEASSKFDYDAALRRSRTSHELRAASSASGVVFWFTVLCWFIAATWSLAQFEQTIALSRVLSHGATTIVVLCISVAVINRFLDFAIARVAARWKVHHYLSSEEQARVLLRIPTTSSVIGHFKTFALVLVALFLSLSLVGLPVHSVVTIGGVAAIAGTLAAQNFLKDMIGGIAVLYEDQYAIGDLVTINDHTGNVENITLRIVMIRDLNGSSVTISHSAVTSVANFSRNWSRIDYQQSLAPEADPDRAIGLIRDTVEHLAQDGDAGHGLLLPIEWIGVHAFTGEWTLVRASIRTAPLRQSSLHREINRRVRCRLAEERIPCGPAIDPKLITAL